MMRGVITSVKVRAITRSLRYLSTTRVVSGLDLSGIYPPIPTPFKENEDIAWDHLAENLKKWGEFPFKGIHHLHHLQFRFYFFQCVSIIYWYQIALSAHFP